MPLKLTPCIALLLLTLVSGKLTPLHPPEGGLNLDGRMVLPEVLDLSRKERQRMLNTRERRQFAARLLDTMEPVWPRSLTDPMDWAPCDDGSPSSGPPLLRREFCNALMSVKRRGPASGAGHHARRSPTPSASRASQTS